MVMKKLLIISIALILILYGFVVYPKLGELMDVSTIGAENGDVLEKTSKGWKPITPVNLTGISQDEVLFYDADSIASMSSFTFDPTGSITGHEELILQSSGTQPRIKVTGSVGGWFSAGTSSNTWNYIGLTNELRIEPNSNDGDINFRDLANSTFLQLQTDNKIVSLPTGSKLRYADIGENELCYANASGDIVSSPNLAFNASIAPSDGDIFVYNGTLFEPVELMTEDSGAPSTTPDFAGQMYRNTANDHIYVAKDTTGSSDWILLN